LFVKRIGWMGWVLCLGLLVVGCVKKPDTAASPKLLCICFLNEHPCESSRRLEAWTKEALEAVYGQNLQTDRLAFKSINYDRPENAHYFKDYALPFQSIVLQDAALPKRWTRLDKLWEMIGDQARFRKYVQDQVAGFASEGR
jgi:hypothetical protein